ncbi:hypothetical protein OnM2_044059 [Erysiphe neolycopersici]|uniref:Uncharacterized protein n=1 Tax=Erysiphe neolycopersici TaxID=212602 RepID=A0A420HUR6_9PEZI|nr:hypothetical protein OnM2_044059 [Erysiphe neolycopersici]
MQCNTCMPLFVEEIQIIIFFSYLIGHSQVVVIYLSSNYQWEGKETNKLSKTFGRVFCFPSWTMTKPITEEYMQTIGD